MVIDISCKFQLQNLNDKDILHPLSGAIIGH